MTRLLNYRRFAAMLLVLAVTLGFVPQGAFAYEYGAATYSAEVIPEENSAPEIYEEVLSEEATVSYDDLVYGYQWRQTTD